MKVLEGKTVEGPISARMRVDGRSYINFFGAGYLALSGIPEIRDAALRALQSGAPFAQQLPATHGARDPIFEAAESIGALACAAESCVYFASGYFIGAVCMGALQETVDLLVIDELAHYSLKDAAKLSGLPTLTFAHCDPQSLNEILRKRLGPRQRPAILTDGVFATSGRVPPMSDYAKIIHEYDGRLVVDESHAFGVVGENGRGAAEYHDVRNITVAGMTLSKALCAHGAIIGCSTSNAARLRSISPLGAACAGSPLSAAVAAACLQHMVAHPEIRVILRDTGDYLRSRLRRAGLDVIDSPAPIVSFKCGNFANMQALQRRAFERGIYIHHSTYIGAGAEGMLRCAIFRDHTRQDVDALIEALT